MSEHMLQAAGWRGLPKLVPKITFINSSTLWFCPWLYSPAGEIWFADVQLLDCFLFGECFMGIWEDVKSLGQEEVGDALLKAGF